MLHHVCLAFCNFLTGLMWSLYKWTYRQLTGHHELQRICNSSALLSVKTRMLESCLANSKSIALRQVMNSTFQLDTQSAVTSIIAAKGIKENSDSQFTETLTTCIEKIICLNELKNCIESEAKEHYTSTNENHESILLQLWTQLKPEEPLEQRFTSQWTQIGFQGSDPATDFRGMGMLGLKDMVHFASKHRQLALKQLAKSHHPEIGYPFAITSINITSMAYEMMQKGYLKAHYYGIPTPRISIDEHRSVQNMLLVRFDEFWYASNPKTIMEFNVVRKKFKKFIKEKLRNNETLPTEEVLQH